ncbi:hypothetical protein SAMN05660293_01579 [Dyadobacter psychrophilus]|uniref:Uncharacterized protein n=1 Tax=Dyadobacter psychrophilus TaxID=651661 RepID=A0A1T5DFB9_9BACT|nr:hypothetical protein SAMN05660293_01579 [Dyadobacter psychrophilus]
MTTIINDKQISIGIRLGSMLLDHFFITMIAMVFSIYQLSIKAGCKNLGLLTLIQLLEPLHYLQMLRS